MIHRLLRSATLRAATLHSATLRAASLALALCCLPALATEPAALRIEHASGVLALRSPPARVVALDLAALDMLDALGVEPVAVPGWKMPTGLARFDDARYVKAGSLFEPDYDAIRAARPDLIVVGGRMREKYAGLAQIAPTLDITANAEDGDGGVARNARAFGKLFGKEAEVEARLRRLADSTEALRQLAAQAGPALLILTVGDTVTAYGRLSRFGALHTRYGLPEADASLPRQGRPVSPEEIAKIDPTWLFVIDRDAGVGSPAAGLARRLYDDPLLAGTRAHKAGRMIYLEPVRQYLTAGSLRTEQAVVDEIRAALNR
ncbi:siderophore ABC transporter substrate-binding protein [Uliginosibacterium sp. H1]|uniref:siderophore ABC transporter substrate-binding protein n=1 Tax=Uliginosibacterium sp. H1 TaxID=3114757 RepID=UPI002E18C58C|nr:ABC transporter substrate-binding protein [Uliginosibacterium sp. H1]